MLGNSGGGSSYAQPWPESGWGCSAPGAVPRAMEQGIGSDGTEASGSSAQLLLLLLVLAVQGPFLWSLCCW